MRFLHAPVCCSCGSVPEGQQKAAQPPAVPRGPRTLWMEAAFITVIIIYGITYWIGRTTNNKLATAWYSAGLLLHLANEVM